jgi:hypothetical protein
MRPRTLYVALLVLAVTGCKNIGQQLVAERTAFNGVLTTLHTGHVVGAVSAKTEREALPYLEATKTSLDAGDAAYIAGDKNTASVYLKSAQAGLLKLDDALKAVKLVTATPKPTTQPTRTP